MNEQRPNEKCVECGFPLDRHQHWCSRKGYGVCDECGTPLVIDGAGGLDCPNRQCPFNVRLMAQMRRNRGSHGPPFDGKPCPFCPIEVRNLAAVVHNYINTQEGGMCSDGPTTLDDLKRALAMAQPLADAHFADKRHSHG